MESQRPLPTLTADLLREIFVRAASPGDLVRASAACVAFCRLITDRSFLRRYSSLHPPLLLGFIDSDGLHPVKAPHPNAAAAHAFARTVDFTFGYLPCNASMCDMRDGHILVEVVDYEKNRYSWDLAFCDPLSRQYQLVPPVPEHLLVSVQLQENKILSSRSFLVPSVDVEETAFRVIGCIVGKIKMAAFIFSSGSGCWSVAASTSWDALSLDEPQPEGPSVQGSRHYAYGCFYWKVNNRDKLIKLDMNTMKFSTLDLPPDLVDQNFAIVEAGDGKLAMFSQINEGTALNYYSLLQNGSKKGGEWHMKNTVPLPSHYTCSMICRHTEGHIFLFGWPKVKGVTRLDCFSLEIKTFKVEKLSGIKIPAIFLPYFGFPPIIVPRTIQGYEVD